MEGSGMNASSGGCMHACMLVACCHYVVGLVMTWQLFVDTRGLAPMYYYRRACYCSPLSAFN